MLHFLYFQYIEECMKLIINKEHTTKAMVAGSNNLIFDSLEADEALSIDGFPSSLIKLSIIVS